MSIASQLSDIKKIFVSGAGQVGTAYVIAILKSLPDVTIALQDIDPTIEDDVYASLRYLNNNLSESDIQRVSFSKDAATVKGAGLTILAVPSEQLDSAIRAFAPHIDRDMITMDTCSGKVVAIEHVQEALDAIKKAGIAHAIDFVATHTFNGNKGSGPLAASDIHKNSPVFIPPGIGSPTAERVVTELHEKLGSRIFQPSPQEHDITAATTSFLTYVRAFAIMQTDFMQDLLQQNNLHDEGNLVQQMLRIADAGTGEIWLSNFKDGKVQIDHQAANFLDLIGQFSTALEQDRQDNQQRNLYAIINECHAKAQVICGDTERWKCKDFDIDRANKYSAFVAFISGTVVRHFDCVQSQINLQIAQVANPSGKDSVKPMTLDSSVSTELITRYATDVQGMRTDFETQYNRILKMIADDDRPRLQEVIRQSTERRKALTDVFKALPPHPSAATALVRQEGIQNC